jgi:hypothetical protein
MHTFRHLLVLVTCVALVFGPQCCCCVLAGGAATQPDDGGGCRCCAAPDGAVCVATAADPAPDPVPHEGDRPCRCREHGKPAAAAGKVSQTPSGAPGTATWSVWILALEAAVPALAGGVVIAPDCRPAAGDPPPRSGRAVLRACGILRL